MNVPIALFVYKRLHHTKQTVESLLANAEAASSRLIIFSDAPKTTKDENAVNEVRRYIHSITGFAQVEIVEREANLGLAQSIITGVSSILAVEEQIIVLEDDLYLSQYFLQYMHQALVLYKDYEKVASIHGYLYPLDIETPDSFFIRGTDCWGWATWRRAWLKFNADGKWLLNELEKRYLTDSFDFEGNAEYTAMLKKQIAGKNDSWAIRWSASAFLEDMYTLYPGKSLVKNIGMDGMGTHSDNISDFDTTVANQPIDLKLIDVHEYPLIHQAFARFYKKLKPSLITKIKRRILK
ncbi:MAG: glycosyltransferase [Ignavibacteriales bacterium]|nr:glycosyltransferase [Ignavibacteriales bacterium]